MMPATVTLGFHLSIMVQNQPFFRAPCESAMILAH
jgi:hypothetical protein